MCMACSISQVQSNWLLENNLYVFLDEITKIFLFPFTECEIDSIAWSDDSLFLAIGER